MDKLGVALIVASFLLLGAAGSNIVVNESVVNESPVLIEGGEQTAFLPFLRRAPRPITIERPRGPKDEKKLAPETIEPMIPAGEALPVFV